MTVREMGVTFVKEKKRKSWIDSAILENNSKKRRRKKQEMEL